MRSFSVKSSALALVLSLTLAAATPALAAARQSRDRDRSWGPIDRIVQLVKRFIGIAHDGIIVPHPEPESETENKP